mgnify:CR=1 FL=1
MPLEPRKLWWSIDELVAAALPGMPSTKRRVNERAKEWRRVPGGARKRSGRGGGWEYYWTVLPLASQRALLSELTTPEAGKPVKDAPAAWAASHSPQSRRQSIVCAALTKWNCFRVLA